MTDISEHFRLAAKEWVEKDGAARMLEESKTSVLAQRISALGEMAHNRAENEIKSSPEWQDYLKKMVEAKTAANLAKVKLEFLRMKFSENQSAEANRRAEMKL